MSVMDAHSDADLDRRRDLTRRIRDQEQRDRECLLGRLDLRTQGVLIGGTQQRNTPDVSKILRDRVRLREGEPGRVAGLVLTR